MRKEAPKVMSGIRTKIQRGSRMLTAAVLALILVLSVTGIGAGAAILHQADLAIRGTVQFGGASNSEAVRAEFQLTGTDDAPMPEADRTAVDLTGSAEQAFSFAAVTYTSPGKYHYQVKQTVISPGYRMDATVYDVTVAVAYEDGTLAAVMYANREGDAGSKAELRFINEKEGKEEKPEPTVRPAKTPAVPTAVRKTAVPSAVKRISAAVKTGDSSMIALWSVIAAAAVLGTIAIAGKRKKRNRK